MFTSSYFFIVSHLVQQYKKDWELIVKNIFSFLRTIVEYFGRIPLLNYHFLPQ